MEGQQQRQRHQQRPRRAPTMQPIVPPPLAAGHTAGAGSSRATFDQPITNSDHPDYAESRKIKANAGVSIGTKDSYRTYWRVLTEYCLAYNWNPFDFSMELAELFAGHMSRRPKPPATLSNYVSAFNYEYEHHTPSLGRPWAGKIMGELWNGYETTQIQATQKRALDNGAPITNGALRVAVPVSGVKLLLRRSVDAEKRHSDATLGAAVRHAVGEQLVWYAIFWLQLLLGFRGDTIGGIAQPSDVTVEADGSIVFVVRRVKRQNVGTQGVLVPFTRRIPPPSRPVRRRVHEIIRSALRVRTPEGELLLGPALLGTKPSKASDKITTAMRELLPLDEIPDVVQGTFISSHSWRKTGASALAGYLSLFAVNRWGMWKSTASCERYVGDFDDPDQFMREIFDWVDPSVTRASTEWGPWNGYGSADEADDGICPPGSQLATAN